VLGEARKQNNRDLSGFGAASKEDYTHGGENRSGPFGHDFLFFFFFLFFFPKKGGDRKQEAKLGKMGEINTDKSYHTRGLLPGLGGATLAEANMSKR
jgi:hypothetical protein